MTGKRDDLGVRGHPAPVPPEAVAGLLVAHEKPDALEDIEGGLVHSGRQRNREELGELRDHGPVLASEEHRPMIAGGIQSSMPCQNVLS